MYTTYPNTVEKGLNKFLLEKFNKEFRQNTGKNINFRPVINGYYKLQADYNNSKGAGTIGGVIASEWKDIKGTDNGVEFKMFNCSFGILAYYDLQRIKNMEKIKFIADKNNYSNDYSATIHLIFGSGGGVPYGSSLTNYKSITAEIKNFGSTIVIGFFGANRLENCKLS